MKNGALFYLFKTVGWTVPRPLETPLSGRFFSLSVPPNNSVGLIRLHFQRSLSQADFFKICNEIP